MAETFKDAVKQRLGGRSMRAFAKELADAEGGSNDADTWRRTLNRYDTIWPDEESAKLIARALGVPRTHLPREPTVSERLAAIEARLEAWFEERERAGQLVTASLREIDGALARLELGVEQLQPRARRATRGGDG